MDDSVFSRIENLYHYEQSPVDYDRFNRDIKLLPSEAEIIFDSAIPAIRNINSRFLNNLDLSNRRITFKDCYFDSSCIFKVDNTELNFLEHDGRNEEKEERFELRIRTKGILKSISFSGINNVNIHLIGINSANLEFSDILNSNIFFYNIFSFKTLFFKIGRSDFKAYKFKSNDASFEQCEFLDYFLFNECKIKNLEMISITFNKTNSLGISDLKNLLIHESNIKKIFFVCSKNNDKELQINKIQINNTKSEEIRFVSLLDNVNKINELDLIHTDNFIFKNFKINKILIRSSYNCPNSFENCFVEEIQFLFFRSYDKFTFDNCKIIGNSILKIKSSILDNVILRSSFLHKVKDMKFKESSIIGLKAYNFQDLTDEAVENINKDSDNDSITLFRELKTLANTDNNQHLFQRFRALEYTAILKRRSYKLNFQDRIILNFNRWSNNHSTEPIYSAGWIGVISIFFAFIILCSLAVNRIQFENLDVVKNLDYFINPLKLLKSYNVEFHWWVYLIEIIYKLFLGYFIYQFIAAFRRFNK